MRLILIVILTLVLISACVPTGSGGEQGNSRGHLICQNAYTGIVTYEDDVEWAYVFDNGWKAFDGKHTIITDDTCVFVTE